MRIRIKSIPPTFRRAGRQWTRAWTVVGRHEFSDEQAEQLIAECRPGGNLVAEEVVDDGVEIPADGVSIGTLSSSTGEAVQLIAPSASPITPNTRESEVAQDPPAGTLPAAPTPAGKPASGARAKTGAKK